MPGGDVGDQSGARAVGRQQIVGQGVCRSALPSPGGDLVGETAEVLHQHDPDRDRHGPELADRQRLDGLICDEIAPQRLGIEMAVVVGDEGPGEAEDPGIAGKGPVCEFWQLPVVAGRKIFADFADLRLDEVVIVEQPLGRRHFAAAFPDFPGAAAVCGQQCCGIVRQPRLQRWHPRRAGCKALGRGEASAVLFQPFDAEQLLAGRPLVAPWQRSRASAPAKLSRHVHDCPPLVTTAGGDLSRRLQPCRSAMRRPGANIGASALRQGTTSCGALVTSSSSAPSSPVTTPCRRMKRSAEPSSPVSASLLLGCCASGPWPPLSPFVGKKPRGGSRRPPSSVVSVSPRAARALGGK